ncbi:heme-binding protein [Sphingomonas sp.]|jgi:glc operon protein GlcG|uniref:GlcG/HbpS family heme-binding protein n=1 Tax=Sphingomonas sp. TaxID=28214 RepID=UPI0035C7D10E
MMLRRDTLSLADARAIAHHVVEGARARRFAVCVAVTDTTTFAQCHLRMDGAPLFAAQGALEKSASASEGGKPTTYYDAMLKAGRTSVLRLPHTVGPGGVPIIVGGSCVGAVGVSGAPPHIDIELAEAAVAAFVSRHSDK